MIKKNKKWNFVCSIFIIFVLIVTLTKFISQSNDWAWHFSWWKYRNDKKKNVFILLRHDKKIKYDNLKILKKNFEFANVQKLKKIWWSLFFWNSFFEYAMICVWSQKKTYDKNNNKNFDKRFEIIQIRLTNEQIDETMQYFDFYINTSKWTNVDYAIKLLWKLRDHVIHSTNEMFYDKHMFENEIDNFIWNLWKHVEYNEAFFKRFQKNKNIERVLRNVVMNFLTTFTTKSAKTIQNVEKSKFFFKFFVRLITSISKNVIKFAEIELNFFIKSNEIQQLNITNVEKIVTSTLINDQKMIIENEFVIFNMRYRWWQTWTKIKNIKIRAQNEFVIENNLIRKLKTLKINFQQMRNEKTLKIDSIITQIDDLHLTIQKISKQIVLNFKQTQNFFHFTKYQRKNLKKNMRRYWHWVKWNRYDIQNFKNETRMNIAILINDWYICFVEFLSNRRNWNVYFEKRDRNEQNVNDYRFVVCDKCILHKISNRLKFLTNVLQFIANDINFEHL